MRSQTSATAEPRGFILGLHHVQLASPEGSEAETRRFFGQVLGLKEITKPPNLRRKGGVWFQAGDNEVHIGVVSRKDFRPNQKAHPAFEVVDLGVVRALLEANGILTDAGDPLEGTARLYTKDPFGNRLEFIEDRRPKSARRKVAKY